MENRANKRGQNHIRVAPNLVQLQNGTKTRPAKKEGPIQDQPTSLEQNYTKTKTCQQNRRKTEPTNEMGLKKRRTKKLR